MFFYFVYPYFYFFCKGANGNIRDKGIQARGQFRALTVWSIGFFVYLRKNKYLIRKLKIRPKGGGKVGRPLAHDKGKLSKREVSKG